MSGYLTVTELIRESALTTAHTPKQRLATAARLLVRQRQYVRTAVRLTAKWQPIHSQLRQLRLSTLNLRQPARQRLYTIRPAQTADSQARVLRMKQHSSTETRSDTSTVSGYLTVTELIQESALTTAHTPKQRLATAARLLVRQRQYVRTAVRLTAKWQPIHSQLRAQYQDILNVRLPARRNRSTMYHAQAADFQARVLQVKRYSQEARSDIHLPNGAL